MISYYYGNKAGILKEIINRFHERYYQAITGTVDDSKPAEECLRLLIHNIVDFAREDNALIQATLNAIPLDISEIADIKAKGMSILVKEAGRLLSRFNLDPHDVIFISIIGPLLLFGISAHFIVKPIQKRILNIDFNDSYYESYSEILATLLIEGIGGVAVRRGKKGKED
ncbi:hypothetical protein ES705_29383 [subsurface metagenome]